MKQYLYLLLATLSLNALNAGGDFPLDSERSMTKMRTGYKLKIYSLRDDSNICPLLLKRLHGRPNSYKPAPVSADRITHILVRVPNLRNLSLGVFSHFPYLTEFALAGSQLSALKADALQGLHLLTHLSLEYNRITSVAPTTFEKTPLLEYLNLSWNKLETVPVAISALSRLTHLVLSRNRITRLEHNSLKGLRRLTHLNISCNPITFIAPGAFSHTPHLKQLDMNGLTLTPGN